MRVLVKLSILHRDIAGKKEITLNFAKGSTVRDVLDVLVKEYPKMKETIPYTFVVVNESYAPDETEIKDGDEIKLLPVIGGG
ncbi:MAG: MoaD/ThiS family protein [Candidatus Thermoplasmatota archaeon]